MWFIPIPRPRLIPRRRYHRGCCPRQPRPMSAEDEEIFRDFGVAMLIAVAAILAICVIASAAQITAAHNWLTVGSIALTVIGVLGALYAASWTPNPGPPPDDDPPPLFPPRPPRPDNPARWSNRR